MGPEQVTLSQRGIVRVGILDDQYLLGQATKINEVFPIIQEALQRDGHTLALPKARAYTPRDEGDGGVTLAIATFVSVGTEV